MNDRKLASFKRFLERRRRRVLLEASKRRAELPEYDSADWLDRAAVDECKDAWMVLENEEGRELQEIQRALARIEEKTYGICEECGSEIKEERLRVVPFARLCLKCKNQEENLSRKGADSYRKSPTINKEFLGLNEEDNWLN